MKCNVHPDVDAIGVCVSCGKAVCQDCAVDAGGKTYCRSCIDKTVGNPAAKKKDPVIALLFALAGNILFVTLLVGLGQLYNGQIKKAIILTLANWVLGIILIMIALGTFGLGLCCCGPFPLIVSLYAIFDAYATAEKINRGEPVKDWLD